MDSGGSEKAIQYVDVRKVFHQKNPRLAPLIPGFVYRFIKNLVHEDYINNFLRKHGHKQGLEFIEAVIADFNVTTEIIGEENLPLQGRFIFAGNHPLGGFDGMVLMNFLGKKYPKIRFLVNDILMNIRNLEPLFVPINKHGPHGRDAARMIDEAMRSDAQILTFPSGLVSRRIKGKIEDLPWKKNFIQKAVQYQRDIIPFHFSGRNTSHFYFLANLRKFLGIKSNLEMFLLPDETYRHRNKKLTLIFGKPIPWKTFDHTRSPQEWADWVRKIVYTLPEKDRF
ncbi:MAG TPA: 1-acyl-sn-glycerol-3-phosphate acyltransferase [Bacteroidales bacterium]|nr:1-acyl-sn-glycerol-3-phosphate acyltransferase [Bacteroidales bacterium]